MTTLVRRRLAANFASILGSTLVQRLFDLAVALLAARLLSVDEFGQYVTVLAFYAAFRLAGDAGTQQLLIREIARRREDAAALVADGLAFQLAWSLLLALVYLAAVLVPTYSPETRLGLLLVLFALAADNIAAPGLAAVQAFERPQYLLLVNAAAGALKLASSVAVLLAGQGFLALVVCAVAPRLVAAMLTLALVRGRFVTGPLATSVGRLRAFVRQVTPFLGITVASAVFLRLDGIILSVIEGSGSMAGFGLAARLADPGLLAASSVGLAVFPMMSRAAAGNRRGEALGPIYERTLRAVLLSAVLFVMVADAAGGWLITACFGAGYTSAIPTLSVFLAYSVLFALEQINGRVFLALGRQDLNLKLLVLAAGLAVPVISVLTLALGAVGAALGDVGVLAIVLAVELRVVARLLPHIRLRRCCIAPLAALSVAWPVAHVLAPGGLLAHLLVNLALGLVAAGAAGLVSRRDLELLQRAWGSKGRQVAMVTGE